MRGIRFLLIVLLSLLFLVPAQGQGSATVSLCRALELVEIGDQVPVTVSGIYADNYLYDPQESECRLNVEPRTCIEFAEKLRRPEKFDVLRKESGRVHATFSGVLYGSEFKEPLANNPAVPAAARLTAVVRYCGARIPTKLVVKEILQYEAVPEDEPWDYGSTYGKVPSLPYPIEMQLPIYPHGARNLHAEGSVLLEVEVVDGRVHLPKVRFGDPILAEEAVANVQTWEFSPDVNTTLDVQYEFRLKKRAPSEGANPSLEMRLPSYVLVIGASNDW